MALPRWWQGPTPKTGEQENLPGFFSAENFANLDIRPVQAIVTLTGLAAFSAVASVLLGGSVEVSKTPAAAPKAVEKKAEAPKPKPAEEKPKPAEKPKAAEKPAAKSVAKPAAKGKDGKAKPKNDLGLDFDEMGLSKEALGLAPPKKKAGPQKPPKPGEKPKAAPKPKPKPTRKQIDEKNKKDRARAEKVSARPCA